MSVTSCVRIFHKPLSLLKAFSLEQYMFGGYQGGQLSNIVEIFDTLTGKR
eukprot:Gb_32694 [translate_table: standard]